MNLCEACEFSPATAEEASSDPATHFHVCAACRERLLSRALRPREWYNLAKKHGTWHYLLRDDFYTDDGTSHQPDQPVKDPELHLAPTLDEVKTDPNTLLDFTITQWYLRPNVAEAWKQVDRAIVLNTLKERYALARTIDVQGIILDVAACALDRTGEAFVSAAWDDFREPHQLYSLANASAACLTHEDGFSRVTTALAGFDEKTRRENLFALSYFRSRDGLDWIEENVCSPVTGEWGRLAAASRFHWGKADSWLRKGRPLSLVALDALLSIVRRETPLLSNLHPELEDKPESASFESTLKRYAEQDNAPRVTRAISALLNKSNLLARI